MRTLPILIVQVKTIDQLQPGEWLVEAGFELCTHDGKPLYAAERRVQATVDSSKKAVSVSVFLEVPTPEAGTFTITPRVILSQGGVKTTLTGETQRYEVRSTEAR